MNYFLAAGVMNMLKVKKLLFALSIGALMSIAASGQSKASAFDGNWVLDRERSNASRELPIQLRDYKMQVAEDQDRLMVRSEVVGPVEVRASGGQSGMSSIVSKSSSRTSSVPTNGVSATEAGTSMSSNSTVSYGGTMALYFTAPETTFDMTGKEIKIEPASGEQGQTKIKMKMGKDGKSAEMTTIRRMKGPRGEMEIYTRDSWKLLEDGKSLKMHRTVESPIWRDEINLILTRVQ
jgi:hypothetical protein